MAKDSTKATEPVADTSAQPEQIKAKGPELLGIDELRTKHKIGRAVFAGVCSAQDWKPGRAVTEAEFLTAVASFNGAPMGPARAANESEARK